MFACLSMRFADCPSLLPTKPYFCHNKCPYFDFHCLGGIFYYHNRKTRLNRLFYALSFFSFALLLPCSIASSSASIILEKSA